MIPKSPHGAIRFYIQSNQKVLGHPDVFSYFFSTLATKIKDEIFSFVKEKTILFFTIWWSSSELSISENRIALSYIKEKNFIFYFCCQNRKKI
jgi:hypothetical protein